MEPRAKAVAVTRAQAQLHRANPRTANQRVEQVAAPMAIRATAPAHQAHPVAHPLVMEMEMVVPAVQTEENPSQGLVQTAENQPPSPNQNPSPTLSRISLTKAVAG